MNREKENGPSLDADWEQLEREVDDRESSDVMDQTLTFDVQALEEDESSADDAETLGHFLSGSQEKPPAWVVAYKKATEDAEKKAQEQARQERAKLYRQDGIIGFRREEGRDAGTTLEVLMQPEVEGQSNAKEDVSTLDGLLEPADTTWPMAVNEDEGGSADIAVQDARDAANRAADAM